MRIPPTPPAVRRSCGSWTATRSSCGYPALPPGASASATSGSTRRSPSTPNRPDECYGEASAAENRRLVEGRTVSLSTDVERRDRFGRLLAYVRVDGRFVNAELVRGGFATTLRIPPNVSHAARLRALEREARLARRGLWGACAR